MEPGIQIAVATGIGAALGAFVSSFFLAVSGWRERVAADKRHRMEWAMKAALEEWHRNTELAKYLSEQGRQIRILPIDTHLVSMLALVDAIGDKKIDEVNVHGFLDRMHAVTVAAMKNTDAYTEQRKK
jgi:hypothetical protein